MQTQLTFELTPVPSPPVKRRSTRRWDIDLAIIAALQDEPKTASGLYRDLNPEMKRVWLEFPEGIRKCKVNAVVDHRTLWQHLVRLVRDKVIMKARQRKTCVGMKDIASWHVTYYALPSQFLLSGSGVGAVVELPSMMFVLTSSNGAASALEFDDWLRLPQGI